ncbi:MAG: DUF4153 domain-containing protein [Lewinellaceae bacterium]|nr:DUF4153 domain-containing protein [Lewinellaceae bacterium]
MVNFYKWFWPVLLPMVLLLFVAIGRRISDYGITEPRFMVAHAGVWLLVVGLYFVISQRDNIKFIPLSLAAFTLVAIVGPFNAFNVSQRNQTSELQRLLEANGRLLEGKTTVSQRTVSDQDAARIESCLKFLEDRDALYRITPWFSKPLDSLPEISPGEDMSTRIMAHLNIQKDQILEASAVYVSPNTPVRFGNIRGFTTYYTLDLYENNEEPPGVGNFVAITPDGHGIAWREKRGTKETDLEVFDLQATLDSCMKNSENGSYFFAKGDETIDFYGKRAEMRLVISDMSLVKREGHATIRSLRGMLYLKDKIK